MKNIKFLIVVMVSIIVSMYSSYAYATTKQDNEQPKEPKKTIRIVIEQSGDIKSRTNLPFQSIAQRLLGYTELEVVAPESKDYDYTLRIQASGEALGAFYSLIGIGSKLYYTGASLSGTMSLELIDVSIHEISFSDKIDPPPQIDTSKESISPSGAPFDKAFRSSDFVSKLAKMLGEVYGPQFLLNALKDEDQGFRVDVRKAIEEMGAAAVEPLIAALNAEDADVRKTATQTLGKIKDPRAVEPLIMALKDEDAGVRESAVRALWEIKDLRAVEPLITALKDEDADVREWAALTLGGMRTAAIEPLIAALKTEDIDSRKAVVEILKKLTGQSFGEDYEAWFKWWQEHEK